MGREVGLLGNVVTPRAHEARGPALLAVGERRIVEAVVHEGAREPRATRVAPPGVRRTHVLACRSARRRATASKRARTASPAVGRDLTATGRGCCGCWG